MYTGKMKINKCTFTQQKTTTTNTGTCAIICFLIGDPSSCRNLHRSVRGQEPQSLLTMVRASNQSDVSHMRVDQERRRLSKVTKWPVNFRPLSPQPLADVELVLGTLWKLPCNADGLDCDFNAPCAVWENDYVLASFVHFVRLGPIWNCDGT